MKFTFKWLKKFLDTTCDVKEIAEKLNVIGFEVEEIIDRSQEIESFQVAEILKAEKHPSADKLKVCNVLTKDGEKQIVCGAPNARSGIKVVFAPVGAIIPNGKFAIKESEIRGVKSMGMMCSYEELLISGDSDGIIELSQECKIGDSVAEFFGLDDPVIDISVTPNRGDALGVYGIARDLAAAGMGKLYYDLPKISYTESLKALPSKNNDAPLFVLREISGVRNSISPLWLQNYLKNIGVGSISPVVDITNYICHSFGRPMHAYDKSKISGKLKVSRANNDEKFVALSSKEYLLCSDDIVIRDDKSIQALGGIIGSAESACNCDTNSIILESALFDKNAITKTGRRLGIDTDSRYRFERYTDPMIVIPAMELATQMIVELCGGTTSDIEIMGTNPEDINKHEYIKLTLDDIRNIAGIEISLDKSSAILQSLGFKVDISNDHIMALAPSWRHDISIKEDLLEEIIRIDGIDNIPSSNIDTAIKFRLMPQPLSRSIVSKRVMAAKGFNEVVTFSFMKAKDALNFAKNQEALTLQNPISSELDYMRPSIIPNLLDIIVKNNARSIYDLSLFEVGPIFAGDNMEDEKLVCSAVLCGNIQNNVHSGIREADIFDIKEVCSSIFSEFGFSIDRMKLLTDNIPMFLHPTRSASIVLGKNTLGWFGEIHPSLLQKYDIAKKVVAFEINLSCLPDTRLKYGKSPDFVTSDFQSVTRDFAFVMDDITPVGHVLDYISSVDKQLIKNVEVFDIYIGDKIEKGKKSVAIKATLQSDERTFSEEELVAIQNNIIEKMKQKFSCILR